jgi:hypothetical protein
VDKIRTVAGFAAVVLQVVVLSEISISKPAAKDSNAAPPIAAVDIRKPGLPASAVDRAELKQLWSVDLSKDPDFAKRSRAEDPILLRRPTLDFVDDDHIIVAFDDNSRSIPEIAGPEMRLFGFHVEELDARTGEVGLRVSWQVRNSTSQAMPMGKGRLLVLVGEQLKELSTKLEEIASLSIPLRLHGQPTPQPLQTGRTFLNPDYESWQIDVAPGGTTAVLAHSSGPEVTLEWLRGADLRKIGSAEFSSIGLKNVFAGNDSALVFVRNLPPILVKISGEHREVCKCRPQMARVLADELIFLAMREKYEIVTTSGSVRSSGKLKVGAYAFHRSEASRFVIATGFFKGSGFPLQTEFVPFSTVRVLDSKSLEQIAEKTFQGPRIPANGMSHGSRQTAVALSPDGHRLLVLIDSILTLFQLP